MSADKRSVFTDALETLGTIISENEKRDAIHLAVEPVIAGQYLRPGMHVGIGENGKAFDRGPELNVGIVDPFLTTNVNEGERFWLVVYPRKITSLRHVWTHPAIDAVKEKEQDEKKISETWIRDWLDSKGISASDYDSVLSAAVENTDSDYLHVGFEAYGDIPSEFWDHLAGG